MDIQSFLIDLDGVLYTRDKPVQGAAETIRMINELGYRYRFVSNTSRKCRQTIVEPLNILGFDIPAFRIFTPSLAAIAFLTEKKIDRCHLLVTGDVYKDFAGSGILSADYDVPFVVVGDAGDNFTYAAMTRAMRLILAGSGLIALEKDCYWMDGDGLSLSAGPFVTALEYATGIQALLMGKPSLSFFERALRDMGGVPETTAMIGDDIVADIGGAQAAGMHGILVKTGKYSEDLVRNSGIIPSKMIDSLSNFSEDL